MKKIAVIVAGGTGGHLYPGIAAARALVKMTSGDSSWEARFVVRKGDRGKELLEKEGFDVTELPGQGWPRRISWKWITFPFNLVAGFVKAWFLLKNLKPQVVVGMGGYLSFPVLTVARLQGLPTLIHEQNVYPGLSNRVLSRWTRSVAVSFADSAPFFPSQKVTRTGLPVRPEIGTVDTKAGRRALKLAEEKLTFLIFGGSQGAHHMNESVAAVWPMLSEWKSRYQVLHITGEKDFEEIRQRYQGAPVDAIVLPYCHQMSDALAAADFVICRAGASTVAELIIAQRPALLVPFPFASENHQFYNAEVLVKRGAAELIPDPDFTPAKLAERLRLTFRNPERLTQMRERMAVLASEETHGSAAQSLADVIQRIS